MEKSSTKKSNQVAPEVERDVLKIEPPIPWTPTAGHIIVLPIKESNVSKGGIVIPESFRKVTNTAYVIKVAKPTTEHEVIFQEGQQVIMGNPAGVSFEHEKQVYIILSQYDIRGYVEIK